MVAEREGEVLGLQYVVAAALAGFELKFNRVRFIFGLFERRLQAVDGLLFARNGDVVALLIEPLLLLDDALNAKPKTIDDIPDKK